MPTTPNVELTPDPLDPREETGGQPATPVESAPPVETPPTPTETPVLAGAADRLPSNQPTEPIMPATTEPAPAEPMTTEPTPPMQPVPAPESASEPAPEAPERSLLDRLLGRNKPTETPPNDMEQKINE